MNLRRAIRAGLVGTITFLLALIYVPQCQVPVYVENADILSFVLGAAVTFCIYKFT